MSEEDASRRLPMATALFGAAVLSFAPLLYQYSDTALVTGAFFRMLYAVPILAVLAYRVKSEDKRPIRTRAIAFLAGLLLALDFVGYHSAIDYVGTGISTLIGNSQVIIVTLVSWWLLGERPNKSTLLALPLVMIGLALISGIWDDEPYGADPFKGVIASIFAAIFYSSFLLVYRYSNRDMAPSSSLQFDATLGAATGLLIVGLMPLGTVGIEKIDFNISWPGHAWLLLLAVSCQVTGWLAITHALPRLPGAHTSFAVLTQPVLTIVWGTIILGEDPSLQQSAGMALILASVISVTVFGEAKASSGSEVGVQGER